MENSTLYYGCLVAVTTRPDAVSCDVVMMDPNGCDGALITTQHASHFPACTWCWSARVWEMLKKALSHPPTA